MMDGFLAEDIRGIDLPVPRGKFFWLTEGECQSKDHFSTHSIPIGFRRRRIDVEIPATSPTH
jgi:hypothetical protein